MYEDLYCIEMVVWLAKRHSAVNSCGLLGCNLERMGLKLQNQCTSPRLAKRHILFSHELSCLCLHTFLRLGLKLQNNVL